MSDDRRKMNKQSTGTVPKVKCRNNSTNERETSPRTSWTNNLAVDFSRLNLSDYLRNSQRRNLPPHPNYCTMNTTLEDQRHINQTMNGSLTPSSSTSRRNSSGTVPKCDNVTKCPDKKQIEDKLTQIREYLQITSSLMSSMKNTDDQSNEAVDEKNKLQQMINDLQDSEAKLVDILENFENLDEQPDNEQQQVVLNGTDNYSEAGTSNSHRNELEDKIDHTNREMELLRDQQLTLLSLQQKAENKMKDARQIQEKLLMAQFGNDVNSVSNQRDKNLATVQDFDGIIKELDERSKRLNEPRGSNASSSNLQDKLLAEVDSLQSQIINLHNVNEDRNQLIQVLDNRDMELRAQHFELQSKLNELQTKKHQVDQLVDQLQNLDEEQDDDDVGVQVRKIVTMKDQLSKLKDMLEIVKTTETVMQNSNGATSQEEQDLACAICTKAENFLHKDCGGGGEKSRTPSIVLQNQRYENNTAPNDQHRHKQINKNAGAKPRSCNTNKLAIQSELEAKKRELEDIMGKHKAGTSNLNHDVGSTDNKSEFSCASNAFFDGAAQGWPQMMDHNRFESSDRYSSDECPDDGNGYSDLSSHNQSFTLPVMNYPRAKTSSEKCEHVQHVQENERSSMPRTPERNSSSRAELPQDRNQLKKQLELIRSVCDSMLEQHQPSNVQLRNNLTPSPLYSEPRRFASPNPHAMNTIVNPPVQQQQQQVVDNTGWLATNNLQTQAFMLNTLNQCCQMLWLQQRELINLRQTVSQIQERVDNSQQLQQQQHQQQFESHLGSPLQNAGVEQPRCRSHQKINQVSAACSMPNLNQYNIPSVNLDPSSSFQNNMQNARFTLDHPCLNNAENQHHQHQINNSVLHAVNANINHHQMPGQIWNGQALNNQVAPGNRANNYWDNFRSYSRQNLLSTKSNEGFQNISTAAIEPRAMNNSIERTSNPPLPFLSVAKSNSEHYQSFENCLQQRRAQFAPSLRNSEQHRNNIAAAGSGIAVPPPDVLNVNVSKASEHAINNRNVNEGEAATFFSSNNNAAAAATAQLFEFAQQQPSSNSNLGEEQHIFKECESAASRRNEWHEEQGDERMQNKSKLFEELRENVYKEVVTLISANEARPHFLIQLFRDLQMISSDPLRLKILQSIQTVITHSLVAASHVNRPVIEAQASEQLLSDAGFSLQSTVWSKLPKNPTQLSINPLHMESETIEMHNAVKEIIPYLNDHEDDTMAHPFLVTLKQVLIESEVFQETVRDSVFKKHFSNVLDELLSQYHGKKVRDVKMHVIQTINDLLKGELSFIQLIQDTCPETCDSSEIINSGYLNHHNSIFDLPNLPVENNSAGVGGGGVVQMQNGDLAEADQGRVVEEDEEEEDVEEEGAVGFWDLQIEPAVVVLNSEEQQQVVDIAGIDFQNNSTESSQTQFIKQGLDQVPTRLPTKSRSNTPSKDRSSSSRSEHSEQF